MKKSFKAMLLVAMLIIASLSLVGCGSDEVATGDKVYKIGTDAAYPPFEKQEGDKIEGFDVEIIEAIAKEAGIKVQVVNTGWDPLFEGINNGSVDAGISAITITDKRKESYDFTEPYFKAKQMIMVPKDSNVSTLQDLDGLKIGVQSATTGAFVVEEAFGNTYQGLKAYDDTPSAVDDLLIGRLDAVVADDAVLTKYLETINNSSEFKLVTDNSFEDEYYGIMVKKGNKELLDKLNKGLKAIKENGTYDQIYNKYFAE